MSVQIIGDGIYETIPKEVLAFKFSAATPLTLSGPYPFWFHLMINKGYIIVDGFRYFIVRSIDDKKGDLEFYVGDYIVYNGKDIDTIRAYRPEEFNNLFRKVK
jgi:hypothetical protein